MESSGEAAAVGWKCGSEAEYVHGAEPSMFLFMQ